MILPKDLIIFDPLETWKKTKIKGGSYTLREMLVPVFKNGVVCLHFSFRYGNPRYLYQRKRHALG